MNMTMLDSSFTNLAAFGQASVILLNSVVYFDNVTFNGNYQSEAGAINVNQSSNATIVNSVFTNNFGYQAGAIAVGCKLACCLVCFLCVPLCCDSADVLSFYSRQGSCCQAHIGKHPHHTLTTYCGFFAHHSCLPPIRMPAFEV